MNAVYWGVEYLATFVEAAVGCKFCEIFLRDRINRNREIVLYSLLVSSGILLINHIQLFSYATSFISIVVMCSLQHIVHKRQRGLVTGVAFIYMVILSGVDFISAQIMALILNTTSEQLLNNQSFDRLQCIFVSKALLVMLIYWIYKINQNKVELSNKYIVMISIIGFILISLNYYVIQINDMFEQKGLKTFSILFFMASVIIILSTFHLTVMMTENYKQKQDVALLALQNEMIIKSGNDMEQAFRLWRNSIHDYKHNIIALKQWVDEGNIEAIRTFVEKENELMAQKMFYIKTGNTVVDAIINTKQNIAEEKGILFSVNAIMPEKCRVNDTDLACMMGNLLDNAIEACENQERKYIEVTMKEKKKMLMIKVMNTFDGELPENMNTTKKNRAFHGIGTKSVQNIVEKYDGKYEMTNENGEVTSVIMILNT